MRRTNDTSYEETRNETPLTVLIVTINRLRHILPEFVEGAEHGGLKVPNTFHLLGSRSSDPSVYTAHEKDHKRPRW